MIIRSRAPVRIDFAGGWTDTPPYSEEVGGYVVNAAINRYTYATLVPRGRREEVTDASGGRTFKIIGDRTVTIQSDDFELFVEAEDVKKLEYDGTLDLLKAGINKMGVDFGLDLVTRCDAPPGSGLGTSASLGVALLGVLCEATQHHLLSYEIAEMARDIEKNELGIWGGKQDQYAAAIGGINFMEFKDPHVRTAPLSLSKDAIYELEKNLVLCYTGKSRLSGDIHNNVVGAYRSGNRETVDAFNNMRQIALEMKGKLLRGDLAGFADLMNENWENQKKLHPSVSNPQIDRLFDVALKHGALGGKACGAGGGGCLVFYSRPGREHQVRRALEEEGVRIIDFNFDFQGLQIWRADFNERS
ncbi:MAG: GHMP family kinase ATP-binding protein [bacterium]